MSVPTRDRDVISVVGPDGSSGFGVITYPGGKPSVKFYTLCGCCVEWPCGEVSVPGADPSVGGEDTLAQYACDCEETPEP